MRIGTLTEQMRMAMEGNDVALVPYAYYLNIVAFSAESVQLYVPWHCRALVVEVDPKLMSMIATRNVQFFTSAATDDQWGQIAAQSQAFWKTKIIKSSAHVCSSA